MAYRLVRGRQVSNQESVLTHLHVLLTRTRDAVIFEFNQYDKSLGLSGLGASRWPRLHSCQIVPRSKTFSKKWMAYRSHNVSRLLSKAS